jgi:transposase
VARRSFALEFKTSAARLVRDQGYSAPQAARGLGVDVRSIRDWVAEFAPPQAGQIPAAEDAASLRQENERLRAENRRLLMEREILKKATAFFAKGLP